MKTISVDRLRQIIDTYGVNQELWPLEERSAAAAQFDKSLATDSELLRIFNAAKALDAQLDGDGLHYGNETEAEFGLRMQHLIQQRMQDGDLPQTQTPFQPGLTLTERFIHWLLPSQEAASDMAEGAHRSILSILFRPVAAASMPLVAGIIIGLTVTQGPVNTTESSWESELSLMAISEETAQEWTSE